MCNIPPPQTIRTKHHRVHCDGSGQVAAALGHPRVYYQIDDEIGFVDCGYCDRRFVLEGGPADQRQLVKPRRETSSIAPLDPAEAAALAARILPATTMANSICSIG